jgi:hypothetical protein
MLYSKPLEREKANKMFSFSALSLSLSLSLSNDDYFRFG